MSETAEILNSYQPIFFHQRFSRLFLYQIKWQSMYIFGPRQNIVKCTEKIKVTSKINHIEMPFYLKQGNVTSIFHFDS